MKAKKLTNEQDNISSTAAQFAAGIGIGIVSGFIGTLVMTAAQMIEMQISGREASDTPYKAVEKTFGIEAQNEKSKSLVSNVTHFAYGSTWGIPRGLMATFGAEGISGTGTHFGAVWGTELTLLPAMDVIEPVTAWKPKAIAEDAMFHAIYALAVGVSADYLHKRLKKSYEQ
jgi:hypothetical protein